MEAMVMTQVKLINLSKRCGNNSYWYFLAVAACEWMNYIAGLMWDNWCQKFHTTRKRNATTASAYISVLESEEMSEK